MHWIVETLDAVVDAEIEALPNDMRARLARLSNIIGQIGFEGLPRDSVKHLENKLWECASRGETESPVRSMSPRRDAGS